MTNPLDLSGYMAKGGREDFARALSIRRFFPNSFTYIPPVHLYFLAGKIGIRSHSLRERGGGCMSTGGEEEGYGQVTEACIILGSIFWGSKFGLLRYSGGGPRGWVGLKDRQIFWGK